MKRSAIFLFILRLFFYLSVISLITIHPGISISFDRIGIIQWFVIVPLFALLAFLPEGKPFTNSLKFSLRNRFIFADILLILLSVLAGGFGLGAVQPFFAGFLSFTLTFLLFHHSRLLSANSLFRYGAKLAALEPFFLMWVCLRLLSLSRSGEEIAGQSIALTQFILVWAAVVFLFHGVVVYFCLYPRSSVGVKKEGALSIAAAAAALVMVLVVLPPDFVRNSVIENLLPQRMPETIRDDSDRGIPRDGENRREGRRTLPRSGDERQPGLRGISEYSWQNRTGRGTGEGDADNRQYMVKIVASEREPVYMGDSFRGRLDPVEGFSISLDEPLNRIVHQRFFVTWFNNEPSFDIGRRRQEVFSLSTLPQKFIPWNPVSVDPTILSENSGPLRYIHQVVSNTHLGDPLALVNRPSRPFSSFERTVLASYLELPLEDGDRAAFTGWLDEAQKKWREDRRTIIRSDRYLSGIFSGTGSGTESGEILEPVNEYLETILAILTGFSKYQYNLNYNDTHSISALKEFLFNTSEGDCVEFSNTLALLGRLAGIPSRVVTGYLAAEGLQTEAHLRGLINLRNRIPVLQEFPFEHLFMVTNLHSHSWTQFYIPDYGWLDFESTAFAIPPVGTGDFSTWDVVIPILDEDRVFSQLRKFPWQAVLRNAGLMAIFALVCAYILRYGRELILYLRVRQGAASSVAASQRAASPRTGARALYLLLLSRLAADGKPIKPASKTAFEYAQLFPAAEDNPHFKTFADLYSQLRWREFGDTAQMKECFDLLIQEYRSILKTTRRHGIHYWFIRIISLRGLAYL